jgi:hypothetical protein
MALRATLVALVFACQACHSAPGATPPGAAEPATKPDATRLPQGTATQDPQAPPPPAPPASCLDRELSKRGLDQFGGPPGTMYAGGTPLFNEMTGKRTFREEYVYANHPDIAAACGTSDAGH